MTETSCVPVASSSGAESNRVTDVIAWPVPRNSLPPGDDDKSSVYLCAKTCGNDERQWKKNLKQPVCVSRKCNAAASNWTRYFLQFSAVPRSNFSFFFFPLSLSLSRVVGQLPTVRVEEEEEEVWNGAIAKAILLSRSSQLIYPYDLCTCASTHTTLPYSLFSLACAFCSLFWPSPLAVLLAFVSRSCALAGSRGLSDFKNVTVRVLAVASRESARRPATAMGDERQVLRWERCVNRQGEGRERRTMPAENVTRWYAYTDDGEWSTRQSRIWG